MKRLRPVLRRLEVAAAATAVLLSMAACGRDRPASTEREGRRGGTVVIVSPTDLDAANPLVAADAYAQEVNRYLLFLPLLRYTPDLEYGPALAESFDMSGDTAVVFHLRRDARWTDGEPVTAYDAAFTIDRARDPATAYQSAQYFAAWGPSQVVDSFTVRFPLSAVADPLVGVPLLPIVPRHVLDTVPPERLRQTPFNRAPVGDGPFTVASQSANDRWVFVANETFAPSLGGRPNLDRIVWRVVPDANAEITELLTGGADLALVVPPQRLTELDARPGLHAIVRPSLRYGFVGWNGKRAPFDDARVRRALTIAIDRADIMNALRAGKGQLASVPVPPSYWAYDSTATPLPYDTAAAVRLLAEAGFHRRADGAMLGPDGKPFRFSLEIPAGNDFNRDAATMIQSDLAGIGVRMEVAPTDYATLIQDALSPQRRFDAVLLAWDADFGLNLHDLFHSAALGNPEQIASYANPHVDTLLDSLAVIADRDRAQPLWNRLQSILREDQPWSILFYYPILYVARDRLMGTDMDVRGTFINVKEWWVTPAEPTAADAAGAPGDGGAPAVDSAGAASD